MRKVYSLVFRLIVLFVFLQCPCSPGYAQCGAAGFTRSQVNWDNLDYLISSGYYAGSVTAAMAATQHFAIGPNRLTIALSATMVPNGENGTNTGELTNYTGDDAQFTPGANGQTITMTFATEVRNANFTLYDIDRTAVVGIGATNTALTPQTIGITLQSGTILTLSGSGTAPVLTASNTSASGNTGSVTISVTGPVKTIVITVTTRGTDPIFWLSDINACVTGSYPVNYYQVSRPFTGMPSYVLGILNNTVYMLNPTNGKAKYLFHDPGHTNINSTAYDPVNRIFYYAYSIGTASVSTNKTLRKWTYDTETLGTVTTDLPGLLSIPSFDVGLASAANNFYDGKLYYGIEAHKLSNPDRLNGQRENIIWRIDLNAAQVPVTASQVYARQADGGGILHDWADVTVVDSIMYDFDSATSDSSYTHYNLMSGQHIQYAPPATDIPRQSSVDWTGQVYCIGGEPASVGYIVPYNYNGTLNNALRDTITIPPSSIPPTGSWGDGGEAFRPLCDFGDAPPSYDPDPWSPAVNEKDTALRIGATFDREWLKSSSILADADGLDEDGIGTVTIFATSWTTYHVQVSVYNNTTANARLIGWLDWDGDGTFEPGEASGAATITSTGTMQNINLMWTGIASTLLPGTYTYLRIRLVSDSLGMNSTHATGWFDNGETEDYRVAIQNVVLPVSVVSFSAKAIDNSKVKLNWHASEEIGFQGYEIQHGHDDTDWETIAFVPAIQDGNNEHDYELTDKKPYKGTSRYRLKLKEANGSFSYSEIRAVKITDLSSILNISPNPASNRASITIMSSNAGEEVHINIVDEKSTRVFYRKAKLVQGDNLIDIPVQTWAAGTYIVSVNTKEGYTSKKLIVRK